MTITGGAPRVAPLDFARLTLGEIARLEQLSGLSLDRIGDEDSPKGKLLAAMALVAARRNGAPISWEEALALTVDEANALLGIDTAPPAADVEGEGGDAAANG